MSNAMANEQAQKRRKQTILLAIGGGLLAVLLVFQLPKLLGGDEAEPVAAESTAGETAATTDGTTTSSGTTTDAAAAPPPVAVPAGKPLGTAYLAGVVVPGGFAVEGGEGDLLVFTQLPAKDPFVQQVDDEPADGSGGDGSDGGSTSTSAGGTASVASPAPSQPAKDTGGEGAATTPTTTASGTSGGGSTPVATPKPPPPTYATISVNGKPEAVVVKEPFPAAVKLFVARKLTDTSATLAVAGAGSFTGGRDAVTLEMGKQLTLVDEATGVRYSLRLLYTGSTPEQVEGFSAPSGGETATAGK